jgi:uncharacterized membrane protein YkvA (DUF1232 family)
MSSPDYSKDYSENSFWTKLGEYALTAGKEVVEKALMLFEALKDKDTPAWAKAVIIAALGYFISPIDAIPDVIPVVGYADDLGALAAAFATVAVYVKEEHVASAKSTLGRWFGDSKGDGAK